MKTRNAPHRRREHMRVLQRLVETIALLALARRIGFRRGGKLLALATATMLDEQLGRRRRSRANDTPIVVRPRDVARLLRQLFTAIRGRRSNRGPRSSPLQRG